MPGYIEDRWMTKRPDPATGKRRRTALYGKGKRYKVAGIPGVRSRSFHQLHGEVGATKWLARAQADADRGEFYDPRSGKIPLRTYFLQEYWPHQTGDPSTLQTIKSRIENRILPYLGDVELAGIKVPQLRKYLADLDASYGASAIIEAWGTLSSILQAAVDDERLPKNPCSAKTVRPPSKPERKARAWAKDRVVAVRAGLDARFQVTIDLGVGAGLRQGEVLGLAVTDVDFATETIHVRRQVRVVHGKPVYSLPKGGKIRTVPLPRALAVRVQRHLDAYPPAKVTLPWLTPDTPETEKQEREWAPQTHDLIVSGEKGGLLRRTVFNEGPWKRALVEAGVIPPPPARVKGSRRNTKHAAAPDDGFHALRHTFASVQLDARESIVAVSRWLGHADPSITLKIYAHMMPEADGRGRQAMDAWFDGQPG
ncbi:site-specific integrase [Streptomyces sp. NPDC049602]|uniref:tyrosine-type recombinase/integrase n=1 Tax=Streptomyces sp. NPDC049602 TaxID=3155504 RepID=UPI00343A7F8C